MGGHNANPCHAQIKQYTWNYPWSGIAHAQFLTLFSEFIYWISSFDAHAYHNWMDSWISTHSLYTIECIPVPILLSTWQKFSQSVDLMSSWVHKHIIRFEGIGAGYMLVMEYASEGPLDHYLRSLLENERKRLGLNSQLHAAFQLIDALEYLVTNSPIIHF